MNMKECQFRNNSFPFYPKRMYNFNDSRDCMKKLLISETFSSFWFYYNVYIKNNFKILIYKMSVFWANQPPFYNLEINNSRDYKDNFKLPTKAYELNHRYFYKTRCLNYICLELFNKQNINFQKFSTIWQSNQKLATPTFKHI